MSEVLETVYLKTATDIRNWIENRIRELVNRHDKLAETKILPNGKVNVDAIEEGHLSLYHIGALSELLILIKEGE